MFKRIKLLLFSMLFAFVICIKGNTTSSDVIYSQNIKRNSSLSHTQATAPTDVTKTSKSTNQSKLYANISLDASSQSYIDDICKSYDISTNVVMAVIATESDFDTTAIGDQGKSFGLMQIQKRYHIDRMNKLDAKDLLELKDNVLVGIDYLAEMYISNNKNWHKALMAYNGGQSYCNNKVKMGSYSSNYSRKVMKLAYKYKTEKDNSGGKKLGRN